MNLPFALQKVVDASLEGLSSIELQKKFENLSQLYRKGISSDPIFRTDLGILVYLATRMPATFGAVNAVFKEMKIRMPDWEGKTILDLGAGPGTASWAAIHHFPSITKAILLDQSESVIRWGKKLAEEHPILSKAQWISGSITEKTILPQADLAIVCYALNEMENPFGLIQTIWDQKIPLLMAIEPGTVNGFERLKIVREKWMKLGGFLVAPCPHALSCPIQKGDWCHFSTRIARTKTHRLFKRADLSYEDEKFSYLILSREKKPLPFQRILRHPLKQQGHVQMIFCTKTGQIEKKTISRRDESLYRIARDAKWGDEM